MTDVSAEINSYLEPHPDAYSEEHACLLALAMVEGIGVRTRNQLLSELGSAREIWQAPKAAFNPYLYPHQRDALCEARHILDPQQLIAPYRKAGIHLVARDDLAYPPLLREIYDPPTLLFVRGDPASLVGRTLAIVGTRRLSDYGRQVTETLVEELVPAQVTIVSGLAEGIDGVAHQSALMHQLPTVAVFGCGLDIVFPSRHKKLARQILEHPTGGALVSEYPLGYPPDRYTFPQRNRIVAGLSYGVLVVEGNIRSGALITANLALDENRQVFAVPGNMFSRGSQGPLHLLKKGATAVTAAKDILDELPWILPNPVPANASRSPAPPKLSAEEQRVWNAVAPDPTPVERLQQTCNLSSPQLSQILTMLELEGLVTRLPGAKVARLR